MRGGEFSASPLLGITLCGFNFQLRLVKVINSVEQPITYFFLIASLKYYLGSTGV